MMLKTGCDIIQNSGSHLLLLNHWKKKYLIATIVGET